jgi:hypothetical protein
MRKPQTRWTADTETAFLLALRQTGAAEAAAAMIGREKGAAYRRRRGNPDFAARWVAAVEAYRAEIAARQAGEGGPVLPHARYDGLSAVRKRAFLRALAETGEIGKAAERAGTTQQTVWAVKRKSPEFAAACEKALRISLPCIEQIAYERAVEGWEEEIVVAGKVVGTRRRWSESLLRTLLTAEQGVRKAERLAAAKAGPVVETATREDSVAELMRRLDAVGRRGKMEARAAALEAAERWEAMVRAGVGFPAWRPGANAAGRGASERGGRRRDRRA